MLVEKRAHTTVLLNEAVEALVTDVDGFYVDGTFGRGGHSELVLQHLSAKGSLLAIDKDEDACAAGYALFAGGFSLRVTTGFVC